MRTKKTPKVKNQSGNRGNKKPNRRGNRGGDQGRRSQGGQDQSGANGGNTA
jgi:hypothetical protein